MSSDERDQLLRNAVQQLLLPLARLCVQSGLPFGQTEELLKRAYVTAARQARAAQGLGPTRDVSQVAVATGLHRRDVARLSGPAAEGGQGEPAGGLRREVQRPAPATQLVARWLSDPALRHRNGRLRRLPRQGEAPSFEALAAQVTRHVHARSLLDELQRRGLVQLLDDGETVELLADRVVPGHDDARLLGFLADNVGDHFEAAVANVLHGDRRHFEQAIFSNALSDEAVAKVRELVQAQWQQMLQALVPQIQQLIDDDRAQGRAAGERLRIGLYSYHEQVQENRDEDRP